MSYLLFQRFFEKLKQIVGYLEKFLSSYLCGYRKNVNKQQTLLGLIENWKKVLGNKGFGRDILMKSISLMQSI